MKILDQKWKLKNTLSYYAMELIVVINFGIVPATGNG
jgi:hypothetical protein